MMNCNLKRMVIFLFLTLLGASFYSCSTTSGSAGIEWGKKSGHRHPPVVKKGGPPPHAPAHGYRAKHRYRYYPSCRVYYDTGRRIYFYLQSDEWRASISLPNNLHFRLGDYVTLDIDTDKPYVYSKKHKKKYPPGQLKEKKKKKNWVKYK